MNAEELAEMQQLIRRAISDPGSILPREDEYVSNWSMRAVLAAIEAHPVMEIRPYYPTQDAYDATCKALEKHRQRAKEARKVLAEVRTELGHDGRIARTLLTGALPATANVSREILLTRIDKVLDGGETP